MYREIASADEKSISITTGINDATEATYTLHAVLAVVALPTVADGVSATLRIKFSLTYYRY